MYTFVLLESQIFVHGTGADPGIFVRGNRIIGKSWENFDKEKKINDKIEVFFNKQYEITEFFS